MPLQDWQAAELERLAQQKHEWELKLEDAHMLVLDIEHELYSINLDIQEVIDNEA